MGVILPLSSWSCQKKNDSLNQLLEIKEHIQNEEEKKQQMLQNVIEVYTDKLSDYSDVYFTEEQLAAIKAGKCLSCDNSSEDPNMWEDKYKNF